jgi:hypothetical protein
MGTAAPREDSQGGIQAVKGLIAMNRIRMTNPEVHRPGLLKRLRGTLDEPLDAIPLSIGDAEDLPEGELQGYPCEYEESEAAGDTPYWATWGF